ncbi:NADPH-dependent assimilatory sulfite reductase hemoprotein subunit [Planctomicrobium sp. SH664]|uniref:NADPH-dependent assimilatory sulfite reductase hemoprotein subunit n=1 Tax=Planctomicrobium sp. SH664 TaxID=3448125 RepID=UPI003F5CBAA0
MDGKASKFESVKESSNYLRGTIREELATDSASFIEDNANLLKFHGTYQQDNRDDRGGGSGKSYMFMVRSRIPGGKITAAQLLKELDLCEQFGNGTLRITDRQGFQLHGILKGDLHATIKAINEAKLSTIAACGDVCRNFMCCPAPIANSPVRQQMQEMADALAAHFRPRTQAYYEIWIKDGEESTKVHEVTDEPIYGKTYLPRKFKFGIALPEDNCIDVYTQDLGLIAVIENDNIVGYNIVTGGGQGMTPAKKDTFPALAYKLCYVPVDQTIAACEAVVKVQRDFGNREDRKYARLKYLIANWGMPKFKAKVEEYYGGPLAEPRLDDIVEVDDHIGWHEQGDGKLFLGINIENGRLQDLPGLTLKTAFRELLAKYPHRLRLTALQGVILCDVEPSQKSDIESILRKHGVKLAEELTLARRYSIACPALPTCGLAVTEAERIMPTVMDAIEAEMAKHGLKDERITVHMTGCPNGCARPYTPDIGLVGKARGKYTLYLGGNAQGTRLGYLYQDLVPEAEIASRLAPVFTKYREQRQPAESFGDFCHRVGKEALSV